MDSSAPAELSLRPPSLFPLYPFSVRSQFTCLPLVRLLIDCGVSHTEAKLHGASLASYRADAFAFAFTRPRPCVYWRLCSRPDVYCAHAPATSAPAGVYTSAPGPGVSVIGRGCLRLLLHVRYPLDTCVYTSAVRVCPPPACLGSRWAVWAAPMARPFPCTSAFAATRPFCFSHSSARQHARLIHVCFTTLAFVRCTILVRLVTCACLPLSLTRA